jgi:hypothetical protein
MNMLKMDAFQSRLRAGEQYNTYTESKQDRKMWKEVGVVTLTCNPSYLAGLWFQVRPGRQKFKRPHLNQ